MLSHNTKSYYFDIVNGVMILMTFVFCRVWFQSWIVYHLALPKLILNEASSAFFKISGVAYCALYLLNLFWFFKIIYMLKRVIQKRKTE